MVSFGQNLTGYVEFTTTAKSGQTVEISHGEILDQAGNFYTENLRTAKQKLVYICKEGTQTFKPQHTFMGFRYIRLDQAPEDISCTAIVVHSDIKRTGFFTCGNEKINQLYRNIIWGQKGNFLDIPSDCPQRDERMGWTGDAQVFTRTTTYNFQVDKFFQKWLNDLRADQYENGLVPYIVPDVIKGTGCSAAWGDAAVICPWQLYLTYGDREVLQRQFDSMRRWAEYMHNCGDEPDLWDSSHDHFGDRLGLDVRKAGHVNRSLIVPYPGWCCHVPAQQSWK